MDEAVNDRPEMTPLSKASSSRGFRRSDGSGVGSVRESEEPSDDDPSPSPSPSPARKRRKVPTPEWVVQLTEGQERRHRERMDGHDRMCNILEKFLEKM